MKICSVSEDKNLEKRIAITPETAKKYIKLGLEVLLPENYGSHLGFKDSDFEECGVKILNNESELLKNSKIILQLGLLSDDKISHLVENQYLIGTFDAHNNKNKIESLSKKKNKCFFFRITTQNN